MNKVKEKYSLIYVFLFISYSLGFAQKGADKIFFYDYEKGAFEIVAHNLPKNDQQRAMLALVCTRASSDCAYEGDGLYCNLTRLVTQGAEQCSEAHKNYIRKYIIENEKVRERLRNCYSAPDGATFMCIFESIEYIESDEYETLRSKISCVNTRAGDAHTYFCSDVFKQKGAQVELVRSECHEHHKK